MPIASRPVRVLAACLVAASLLGLVPGSAAALTPPRPLPGYRPAFVTETDTRPWIDCLWSSGAMLLDKWTNGRVTATHGRLRRLSGDTHRGSTLADLRVAYAKLGIDLAYSPDGGARITWGGLLNRLAHGGGAVLLGHYSKLPRWYGRWDYRFWKGKAKTDNHAVYVERYDRKRGRVWLMDPLGRGDWKGEWISIWSLRRFAWTSGSLVYAAMTPRARPAPFAKVRATQLELGRTSTGIDAAWNLQAPRKWRYPGAHLHATFAPADDPLVAAAILPSPADTQPAPDPMLASGDAGQPSSNVPADGSREDSAAGTPASDAGAAGGKRSPTVVMAGRTLRIDADLPDKPGAYEARLRLTDRRFGRTVVDTGTVAVFVPGPRQATIGVATNEVATRVGAVTDLVISIRNSGTETWAEAVGVGPASKPVARKARLVARWIQAADADGSPVAGAADGPDPIVLSRVPLAPGRQLVAAASIRTPTTPGRWAIVIDVVDAIDGSYAALGSRPGIAMIDVVDAPGALDVPGSTTAFTVLSEGASDAAGAD